MLPILAEGAREVGVDLTDEQLGQFQRYLEVLTDWAERVSLTTVKDEEGIQRRHFLESASLVAILNEHGISLKDKSVIDVGTGTGVPGVPLKILEPSIQLTLVEAKQRKVEYLEALMPELGLEGVTIVTRRAEEAGHNPAYRDQFDIAVAKALAPLRTLVELTLPFLHMGGIVVAPKGKEADAEVKEARVALETLKGSIRSVEVIPLAQPAQKVILVEKDLPTPPRFPRRPGMPAKRPL